MENADAARTAAQQRVAKLKARKARLVEVYVFEGGIDKETYVEQLARISGELDAAELDHQEAVIGDMDVDGIFHFAQHVLADAARIWVEMGPEAKRRLNSTSIRTDWPMSRTPVFESLQPPRSSGLWSCRARQSCEWCSLANGVRTDCGHGSGI